MWRRLRQLTSCRTHPARLAGTPRTALDAGMTTAEYAVGTLAACAFAAVLYKVITSESVSSALTALLERALNVAS